jgi:FkbM family methyltransferase
LVDPHLPNFESRSNEQQIETSSFLFLSSGTERVSGFDGKNILSPSKYRLQYSFPMSQNTNKALLDSYLKTVDPWTKSDFVHNLISDGFLIMGAGSLGSRTIHRLAEIGVHPTGVVDNNRWGESIGPYSVMSVSEAIGTFGTDIPFVVTIWQGGDSTFRFEQVQKQLMDLGVKWILSVLDFYWTFPDALCPYLICDSPSKTLNARTDISRAIELFHDEESVSIYLDHVGFRVDGDFSRLHRSIGGEYFDFLPDWTDVGGIDFYDLGSYTGDTIRAAVDAGIRLTRVAAVEPDPNNFMELESQIQKGRFPVPVNALRLAVGATEGKIGFEVNSDMTSRFSSKSGNLYEVDVVSVDALRKIVGWEPTLVKLDVEGAELQVIAGAKETIRSSRPIWAIALEHNFDDLWTVPLAFNEVAPDYRYFLRHYSEQGFDVVLYAVPVELKR